MDHSFWLERWRRNEIGFHMEERHTFLHRYYHRLHVGPEVVFVPLCGKSPDLLWLRQQGARVLGVELSEIAVSDFFRENNLEVKIDVSADFRRFHSERITLLCGDFFALGIEDLDGVRAVYDRGALVALPTAMRREYADHLGRILPSDSRILLVSYDYAQEEVAGPPFSVPATEIEALFGKYFSIEILEAQDALPTHNALRQRGVSSLTEFACLLTHR